MSIQLCARLFSTGINNVFDIYIDTKLAAVALQ